MEKYNKAKTSRVIKVGIDLDQYIITDQEFFRIICFLLAPEYEIHLISNQDEGSRKETVKELEEHRIHYSQLVLTGNKAEYLHNQGIEIELD